MPRQGDYPRGLGRAARRGRRKGRSHLSELGGDPPGGGKRPSVEGGGRCRWAGLCAASPGAAGQRDLRMDRQKGPAGALRPTGEARRLAGPLSPGASPFGPAPPPLGRGAGGEGAGSGCPDSFPGPAWPGVGNKHEAALVCSHPPASGTALLRLPSSRGAASPPTPLGGVGIPLPSGNPPPPRCSGARWRGRRAAALCGHIPGCTGHRGPPEALLPTGTESCSSRHRPRRRRPPSSLLPLRGRGAGRPVRARPGEGNPRSPASAAAPGPPPRAPPALRLFRFRSSFKENISSNPDFWKITTGGETQTQTPLKFIQSLNNL
ncbi:collagen alpha-1(I) chain-like [Falco cherrug]|uniref:collagen alpha-1(I) chain-like n=1 Tax=Falco cherrug TaxID=345164 RepID=UPI00247A1DC7|nr:collagen alpha-1(I) chain-like [Falco cherrug]